MIKEKKLCCALALGLLPLAAGAEDIGTVVVTAPTMSDPLVVTTDPKAPRQPVPAADGADFLKNIAGFSVVRKGGTSGDPVLRGLAGSRLNILQDGNYLFGGCGGRMDPPTAYIYPGSFDEVTVIKGPQTVLYGPGNVAGTVLFERRTERFEEPDQRFFANGLVGSYGRNDQVVDATLGAQKGFLRVIGTRSEVDDYEDGDGTEIHSEYRRWSGTAIGGWTPSEDTRLELSIDRSDGEAAYADRSLDGSAFEREGYGLKFEKMRLSRNVEKLELQYYTNYVDHVMDNYTLREPGMMKMVMNPDRDTTGARASMDLNLGGMTFATLGIDYQEDQHSKRGAQAMASAPDPDFDSKPRMDDLSFSRTGVFAEFEHQLNVRDALFAGVRMDRTDTTVEEIEVGGASPGTGDEDTTRGAFVRYERSLQSPVTVFAGLGRAERSPDFWERNKTFEVDPEVNTQLDLGLGYGTPALAGNLAAFYADIQDYILIDWEGGQARNIDAVTYGLEGDLTWKFAADWRMTGTLAYVRGENETDDRALAQIPPLEGTLALDYDNRTYLAGVLLRAAAEQDRVDVGSGSIAGQDFGTTPGFGVLSMHAGYRPSENVKLTAGIDNVLDKTYVEHLSKGGVDIEGFEQVERVNEPGRTLWLQASAQF
ncbi:TonB-dependent copper receptor [Thiohalomonas denitrificans]|uniref:TonB-dependent copper receptor n=1 Tax=Thiohalomonas denitrificans TaxID=415747 RepID=UPI0026EEDA77|nr:TonB-dependent copper receptor [Thiohalomonas denitrificans]